MSNPFEDGASPPKEGDSTLSSSGSVVVDTQSVVASALSMAAAASSTAEEAASPSWSEEKPVAGEEKPSWSEEVVAASDDQGAALLSSNTSQTEEKKKSKSLFAVSKLLVSKLSNASSAKGGEAEGEREAPGKEEDVVKASSAAPIEDTHDELDDKTTPLLPPDATEDAEPAEERKSKFFCEVCSSRRALIVVNLLSLVTFFLGFIAVVSPGHISVNGQNVTAMVFNIFFTVLIVYGAFQWNRPIVLMGLLWEAFVLVFSCVGIRMAFGAIDWTAEPKGTQQGTEAFVIIAVLWEFVCIYAQLAFVYELTTGIAVPGGHGRVLCTEDHDRAGEGEHV